MLFRSLFDEKSHTYTYLLAEKTGSPALLIDPVKDKIPLYQQLLSELNLTLTLVMDTHTHADHITATGELAAIYSCEIAGARESQAQCITRHLQDGDLIEMPGLWLKALHTPGHTDDSYCFVMDDRVFTGDTLMIRSTGRTDFQSGNATQQYHSLWNKILTLPDETLLYPAHDYQGMTVSTIGEEKQFNPRLQVKSEVEYVKMMQNLNLPRPEQMDIALPANLQCGLANQKEK